MTRKLLMPRSWVLAAVLLFAGLSACGEAAEPDDAGSAAEPEGVASSPESDGVDSAAEPAAGADVQLMRRLTGRQFESTAVDGYELLGGTRIVVSFISDADAGSDTDASDGSPAMVISSFAGCNYMGGAAKWDGDSFSVLERESTAQVCDSPLMTQEDWWTSLQNNGMQAALVGDDLTLRSGGVTIELTDFGGLRPDRPLQGTTWRLDATRLGYAAEDAVITTVPAGLNATLLIESGHLDVYDGSRWWLSPDGNRTVLPATVEGHEVFVPEPPYGRGLAGGRADDPTQQDPCADMGVLAQDFQWDINFERLSVSGVGEQTIGCGLIFVADDDLLGYAEG